MMDVVHVGKGNKKSVLQSIPLSYLQVRFAPV